MLSSRLRLCSDLDKQRHCTKWWCHPYCCYIHGNSLLVHYSKNFFRSWSCCQHTTYPPWRTRCNHLPHQALPDRFSSHNNIQRIDAITFKPLCDKRLRDYPEHVKVRNVFCLKNYEEAINTISASTADAVLVHMLPHYVAGWPKWNVTTTAEYSPSFIARTKQHALRLWGYIPTNCLHIRVEKLQHHGIQVEKNVCIANVRYAYKKNYCHA